jgi:hypothetical protein
MQTQVGNDLLYNKPLAKECLDMIFNQHKTSSSYSAQTDQKPFGLRN